MKILITGGAGFVGSKLALQYRQKYPQSQITVFDNLRRRGSEINLSLLAQNNIEFIHGDLRVSDDIQNISKNFDLFIEASAEPSVLAGMGGGNPTYAIQTNLVGTTHCLEYAKKHCGMFLFLSTSRVYSIPALLHLELKESITRFESPQYPQGFDEHFSTSGYRSIYGATKLASELLIQEYSHAYGLKTMINRCGVIAGPGQFGKVDQGVFTLWVARHHFNTSLKYTGFGGIGKQVRDLLHPLDLFELIELQTQKPDLWTSPIYNIGGGLEISTSLLEWTNHCQEVAGKKVAIESVKNSASVDIPFYISNCKKAEKDFNWKPKRTPRMIASDIFNWIKENESQLKPLLGA